MQYIHPAKERTFYTHTHTRAEKLTWDLYLNPVLEQRGGLLMLPLGFISILEDKYFSKMFKNMVFYTVLERLITCVNLAGVGDGAQRTPLPKTTAAGLELTSLSTAESSRTSTS